MRPIAYAYHTDLHCADCGADLPDIDPEGNERYPVFHGEAVDYIPYCASCGECIDGYSLTSEGVRHTVDFLAKCAVRLNVGVNEDVLEDALRYIQPHKRDLTIGERALIAALAEGDDGAAYAIARWYRAVDGGDPFLLPAPIQEYWPYD